MSIAQIVNPMPEGFKFLNLVGERYYWKGESWSVNELREAAEKGGFAVNYETSEDGNWYTGLIVTTRS